MMAAREVTLSLFHTSDSVAKRSVILVPDTAVLVGRASKDFRKNLVAQKDNFWLESPVVSRIHARVKYHEQPYGGYKVTIEDLDSSHGTMLNGIRCEVGAKMVVTNGDKLQFGAPITRGEENFSPPIFKAQIDTLSMSDNTHSSPAGTYAVPAESIANDSDNESTKIISIPDSADEDSTEDEYDDDEVGEVEEIEEEAESDVAHDSFPDLQLPESFDISQVDGENLYTNLGGSLFNAPEDDTVYMFGSDPAYSPPVAQSGQRATSDDDNSSSFLPNSNVDGIESSDVSPTLLRPRHGHNRGITIESLINRSTSHSQKNVETSGTKRKRVEDDGDDNDGDDDNDDDEEEDEDDDVIYIGNVESSNTTARSLLQQRLQAISKLNAEAGPLISDAPPEVLESNVLVSGSNTEEPISRIRHISIDSEVARPINSSEIVMSSSIIETTEPSASTNIVNRKDSMQPFAPPTKKRKLGNMAFGLACFAMGTATTIAALSSLPESFFA